MLNKIIPQEAINEINAVLKKYSIETVQFKGQTAIEEKIITKQNNPASYNARTYGNMQIYNEFKKRNNDHKYVWIQTSSAVKNWGIRESLTEAYNKDPSILPDRDPTSQVLIDYMIGDNKVTSLPEFQPSVGHIMSRDNIKVKKLEIKDDDISNIEIESLQTNIYKNKGNALSRFQLFVKDIKDSCNSN